MPYGKRYWHSEVPNTSTFSVENADNIFKQNINRFPTRYSVSFRGTVNFIRPWWKHPNDHFTSRQPNPYNCSCENNSHTYFIHTATQHANSVACILWKEDDNCCYYANITDILLNKWLTFLKLNYCTICWYQTTDDPIQEYGHFHNNSSETSKVVDNKIEYNLIHKKNASV